MAQGDSTVGICNAALIALGEDVIASLEEPSKRAQLCAARYHPVRRELLRRHPWNCAKRQATLAASATTPIHTYDNAFPVPSDCLRVVELPDYDEPIDWEEMDSAVLTDAGAPLNIVYIYDLQDPVRFDALFARALAVSLAIDICEPLTQNTDRKKSLQQDLAMLMPDARLASASEASSREFDDDVLLRARR